MGFPRPEYWNGLPFPLPGDLSDPGIEPAACELQEVSYIAVDSLLLSHQGSQLTSDLVLSAFKRRDVLGIVAEEQVRDVNHQHVSLSHCWLTTRRDHEKRNLNLWLEAENDLQPSGSRKTGFAFYLHKEVNSANIQEGFVSRFPPENPRGKSLANTWLRFQSCYSKHNGKLDIRLTSEEWGVTNQDYSPHRELHKPYITKVKVKVARSCLTLCDPMDYTVHGIL